MRIRVTFVSANPIPESLIAMVPHPVRVDRGERRCGRFVSIFAHHDDPTLLREALRAVAGKVAVGVIEGPLAGEPARLLMLDVDSTLTTTEAIDLLAEHAGLGERVAEITERAMRGELDFGESLAERVSTLEGLPTSVFAEVGPQMTLSAGARELIATARTVGARVGVTSGGFTQLVGPLASSLGLDFFNANQLETRTTEGVEVLTGRVIGQVVDRDQKARDLLSFAHRHGIDPAYTAVIGDGANDLGMFAAAGISVAYCAKPVTAAAADVSIPFPALDAAGPFVFPFA